MPKNSTEASFEKRLILARKRAGNLTQKQVNEYLESLEDCADECEESEVPFTTPCADRARNQEAAEASTS